MDIGLRVLILAIGLALMAAYYFFVVKPKQRYRGYGSRVRAPGMFTPKPQVPTYPDQEYDYGDVVVTRRLGPDGEEIADDGQPDTDYSPMIDDFDNFADDNSAGMSASGAASQAQTPVQQVQKSATKPKRPLNLAKEPKRTPVVDPNQRSPYDIAAEKAAAKKAELMKSTQELLSEREAYQSEYQSAGTEQSVDSTFSEIPTTIDTDHSTEEYTNDIPHDLDMSDDATNTHYQDSPNEEMASMAEPAVDEVRVDSSRSKSRRFSQRGLKFASPLRQKKKSVDSVIPDDAKGTSQGKLSYSPVSPVVPEDSETQNETVDTGADDNYLAGDDDKPKKMVVITLHPQVESAVFRGTEIRSLMETFSLTLSSKTGFFECMDGIAFSGKAETIFSVGHLRGNGRFERTKLPSVQTSGLIFFMTIPGPVNAADAVDMMFSIGAKAAKMLNAKLCDQKKTKLTVEQMINIRDEAVSFEKALMDQNLL